MEFLKEKFEQIEELEKQRIQEIQLIKLEIENMKELLPNVYFIDFRRMNFNLINNQLF